MFSLGLRKLFCSSWLRSLSDSKTPSDFLRTVPLDPRRSTSDNATSTATAYRRIDTIHALWTEIPQNPPAIPLDDIPAKRGRAKCRQQSPQHPCHRQTSDVMWPTPTRELTLVISFTELARNTKASRSNLVTNKKNTPESTSTYQAVTSIAAHLIKQNEGNDSPTCHFNSQQWASTKSCRILPTNQVKATYEEVALAILTRPESTAKWHLRETHSPPHHRRSDCDSQTPPHSSLRNPKQPKRWDHHGTANKTWKNSNARAE